MFLVMAVIFSFSSKSGVQSKAQSVSLASQILKFFNIDEVAFEEFVGLLRRMAHFALFALLGAAVCYALMAHELKASKVFLYGLAICLLYAISDEVHQAFVPERAPQLTDVFVDFAGSLCGSGFVMLIYKITNIRRNRRK